jgi:iron complex transport system substrate-binding protein
VASALGEARRAGPWLLKLRQLEATVPRETKDAVWLGSGGLTLAVPSAGADWLRLAGLRQRAMSGGNISLESLLVRPPQVLVQSRYRSKQMSLGAAWLAHPIVRKAKSQRVQADGRAWTCMGPLLIDEIKRLRAQLR